jgi:hypothetical protein
MGLFVSLTLAALALFTTEIYLRRIQKHYALRKASAKHGCASPKTLPSRDPFFGLDTFFATFKSMKNHCRMRTTQADAQKYGHTYQSFPFARRTITITSARNIQTVLSLEHEKFGVRPIRGPTQEMTGPGIIVNDGKVWEHARAMIRPAFTRTLIANRELFDVHVERFFELLPTNGSVIDLQPLFDRLVGSNLRPRLTLLRFWIPVPSSFLERALDPFCHYVQLTRKPSWTHSTTHKKALEYACSLERRDSLCAMQNSSSRASLYKIIRKDTSIEHFSGEIVDKTSLREIIQVARGKSSWCMNWRMRQATDRCLPASCSTCSSPDAIRLRWR